VIITGPWQFFCESGVQEKVPEGSIFIFGGGELFYNTGPGKSLFQKQSEFIPSFSYNINF